ncbi:MAG: O-antigen ligase family protein [Muricomes sp.]
MNKPTRKQDLKHDYSSGRMGIWKGGLQIVKESPVIGIGYRNIAPYTEENFPESYLIKNVYGVKYDSMHNVELDILIAQGALGAVITILLAGNTLFILYRNLRLLPKISVGNDMFYSRNRGIRGGGDVLIFYLLCKRTSKHLLLAVFWICNETLPDWSRRKRMIRNISRIYYEWKGRGN